MKKPARFLVTWHQGNERRAVYFRDEDKAWRFRNLLRDAIGGFDFEATLWREES